MTSSRPIKTLIVDLSMQYGGSTSRVLELMKHLPTGEAALASLAASAVTRHAHELNLPIHTIGRSKMDPRILANLIRLIRAENFQVLDSQNIQSKFWASLAARLTHTALISTIHSWYENEHGRKSIKGKIYTQIELSTNSNLSYYITVSEKDRQSLLQSGFPEERIQLIYNAVTIDPELADQDPKKIRDSWGLPQNAWVCLAVGRLVPVKGYDVLIDAIALARTQIPEIHCIIVGEGESRENLTNQIKHHGLESRIRLVGYYGRIDTLSSFKACDVFVMPSRYEGTPIALLESAAFGCPIIASRSGGIPEVVTHEQHALLVPPENPDALAQALIRLSQNRQFASLLGANAKSHIAADFNLDNQVRLTKHIYKKAFELHTVEP
jgi:glycosyltransferase involved in cell wall biosynthesis